MPTYIPKGDDIQRDWFVIDAKDKVLGRVATLAASILSGKTKPVYTPFLDTGDHVVVINAGKVALTGGTMPDGSPAELGATTAEVARRQADGTWLYVIDNAWGDLATA